MSKEEKDLCAEEVEETEAPEEPETAAEPEAEPGTDEVPKDDAPKEETSDDETPDEEAPEEGTEEPAPAPEDEEPIREKYLRLMADFQNYKKRVEKERSDVHAYANEKIVTDLLQVIDNFERALATEESDGFKEGMAMIFDQMKDVLTHAGMAEIEAFDTVFDPNLHNAVMMEDTDAVESGNVSEVLQKGYTLNGKVIRPSMVKVAK